jgi:4-hydroxy-tetrahydrodipicolinate reductase
VTTRVVQWTTGNIGKESVKAILANAHLELVGCYAWSATKNGVDVGELVGIAPLGFAATSDVDALLALQPDCVVYNPMWPSIDELVRILESGANVVTTAAFINGRRLGADRDRLVEACERGRSSLMGTGISPGFVELIAITVAGMSSRIDKVIVSETADSTFYDSPDTERPVGFGHPIDHPDLHDMARDGTAVFGEAVAMVADGLGVELDEIVCTSEFAQATQDVEMKSWTIPAGCVAGVAASWQGRAGGRTIIDLNVRWRKGSTLDPDWVIEKDGWVITVEGLPSATATLDFFPAPDFEAQTIEDFMTIGHIITAVPALNAIPAVIAAPPGIVTYPDLTFPTPRGWVHSEDRR